MSTVLCVSSSLAETHRLLRSAGVRKTMSPMHVYKPVEDVASVRGLVNVEVWLLPGYEKHPEWKEMWIYLNRPGILLTRKGGNLDV